MCKAPGMVCTKTLPGLEVPRIESGEYDLNKVY
jgi:hypothetical protein